MALDASEKKLLTAIKSMLSHDLLGLNIHDVDETSHHSQFRWEGIANAFRLKCADSPYCDSMSAAFRKTHDYKYIDHPTFKIAMEADMRSMGLPNHVREEALKHVDELINELSENKPSERDAGWGNVADLKDVTTHAHDRKAPTSEPYTGGGPNPKGDKRKVKMEGAIREVKEPRPVRCPMCGEVGSPMVMSTAKGAAQGREGGFGVVGVRCTNQTCPSFNKEFKFRSHPDYQKRKRAAR